MKIEINGEELHPVEDRQYTFFCGPGTIVVFQNDTDLWKWSYKNKDGRTTYSAKRVRATPEQAAHEAFQWLTTGIYGDEWDKEDTRDEDDSQEAFERSGEG